METAGNRSAGRHRERNFATIALLLIGFLLWYSCLRGQWGSALQWKLIAGAIVLGLLPPARRMLEAGLDRIGNPSPTARFRIATLVFLSAAATFLILAYVQDWDFILRYQDEHSYAIQTQMMARGRLWMPALAPAIADFFSSYTLFTSPTYGSMYFVGTAMMYWPMVWLHLPFWVLPLIAAAACVALTYRIITELIDGVAGLLAALMMVSLPAIRSLSLMLLSQTPMLLLGLGLILAWLCWRRQRRLWLELAIGGLAGWALVTRPLDALAYAVPVCSAILADMLDGCRSWKVTPRTIAVVASAGMPFLILQSIQNSGMTGSIAQSPEAEYAARNLPGPMLGFDRIDWSRAPTAKLPEDRELLETSTWPTYRAHQLMRVPQMWWKQRLPLTLAVTLPNPLLAVLIPLGLAGIRGRQRAVLAASSAMFCLLYSFSVWYQAHYITVIVPGVLLLVLLGIQRVQLQWPGSSAMLTLTVAAISVGAMSEIDSRNWSPWLDLVRIENKLATLPQEPSIVLFRYHPFNPAVNIAHHEPVYNTDVAWPDDAMMIRAHDLGSENIRLFEYYAQRQPNRMVYLYERDGDTLTPLGTPAEAARSYNETLRSSNGR